MANRREVETMLALHRLMRRDSRRFADRLRDLADRAPAGVDRGEVLAVARWFDVFQKGLNQHHEVEDDLLFPLLGERDMSVRLALAGLCPQHEELRADLRSIERSLSRMADGHEGAADDAVSAAERVHALLDEHIPAEEEIIVPVSNLLSDADFKALDKEVSRKYPLRDSVMTVPWLVDGLEPAERDNLYAWQGSAARVVYGLTRGVHRRRARDAGMLQPERDPRAVRFAPFTNAIGVPDELVPVLERSLVCSFASMKRDGTPVTAALSPVAGEDGSTIDISTALVLPTKAERARHNSKVCLLFAQPAGLPGEEHPVVLVHAQASVRDADLQANTDRYVESLLATTPSFRRLPNFVLRAMRGYLVRIWVSLTPMRILWWPGGDTSRPPRTWSAPEDTTAPPSDPAPAPRTPRVPLVPPADDVSASLRDALSRLGPPVLATSDPDGAPVPFPVLSGEATATGARLELAPGDPPRVDGRACLSFHTLTVKNGEIAGNRNRTYIGDVTLHGGQAEFVVERELPTIDFEPGFHGTIAMIGLMRNMRRSLEAEARHRGQGVPEIRVPRL